MIRMTKPVLFLVAWTLLLVAVAPAFEPIVQDDIDAVRRGDPADATGGVAVLMYHALHEEAGYNPESFREQMRYLANNGFNCITIDHLADWIETGSPALPDKPIILTFDDNYISIYSVAYPIMKELGLFGYNFTHTQYVGVVTSLDHADWNEIWEMESEGVIFTESHTVSHPNLTSLNDTDHYIEVVSSKAIIEENMPGKEVLHLAYPYGNHDQRTIDVAKEAGYRTGISTISGLNFRDTPLFKIRRFAIDPNRLGSSDELSGRFKSIVNTIDVAWGEGGGAWRVSTSVPGYLGDGYLYVFPDDAFSEVVWRFNVPPGTYFVDAHWTEHANRATNAPYTIAVGEEEIGTYRVDQTIDGSQWNRLEKVTVPEGADLTITLNNNAVDGVVIADGVRLVPSPSDMWMVY